MINTRVNSELVKTTTTSSVLGEKLTTTSSTNETSSAGRLIQLVLNIISSGDPLSARVASALKEAID